MPEFLLAVDGGGSGTRVIVATPDGRVIGHGQAGPSALGQGVAKAWEQIALSVQHAFFQAAVPMPAWERCAMAAGLSGVHNDAYCAAFKAVLPAFVRTLVVTDSHAMLIGAHAGQPGILVAAGTGSVGEALYPDATHRVTGGWGFPVGDEGSGAWLGLKAVAHAQAAMDGRLEPGPLAHEVWQECGADRQTMAQWVAGAGQHAYAQIAPCVWGCAHSDPVANHLLDQAAAALASMAVALDPAHSLPVVISGSIGERLTDRLPDDLKRRCVKAAMGPVEGAMCMLRENLGRTP